MLDPNPPPRVRGQTSGGGRQTFKLKIEDADVDMAAKRASLDRIVKRAEAADRTDSGIFLPESAKDKPKEGKIVALGNGILNKETGDYLPFTVKKGDAVLFSSYAGTEIKIDGEDLIIMTEEDILAVIG